MFHFLPSRGGCMGPIAPGGRRGADHADTFWQPPHRNGARTHSLIASRTPRRSTCPLHPRPHAMSTKGQRSLSALPATLPLSGPPARWDPSRIPLHSRALPRPPHPAYRARRLALSLSSRDKGRSLSAFGGCSPTGGQVDPPTLPPGRSPILSERRSSIWAHQAPTRDVVGRRINAPPAAAL